MTYGALAGGENNVFVMRNPEHHHVKKTTDTPPHRPKPYDDRPPWPRLQEIRRPLELTEKGIPHGVWSYSETEVEGEMLNVGIRWIGAAKASF